MTAKMDVRRKARAPRRKIAPPAPKDGELKTGSLAPQSAASRSIAESIGAQVRSIRRKLDLTGTELAVQAGLSAGMLSKIENGGISPSLATLDALAKALNVPISALFAETEERRDCSFVKAGSGVRWIRSYVVSEDNGDLGTVCIYEAESPETIRAHAQRVGMPADEITPVADTVIVRPDPVPAAA